MCCVFWRPCIGVKVEGMGVFFCGDNGLWEIGDWGDWG